MAQAISKRRWTRHGNWPARYSWCLYDWANSAFIAVIITFVVPAYFVEAVATSDSTTLAGRSAAKAAASSDWLFVQGIAAFVVAAVSPIFGAVADRLGRRKIWLGLSTLAMVGSSLAIWWVKPRIEDSALLLWSIGIGIVGFEFSMVFYNAMLGRIAQPERVGRLSGSAWALGYLGGLACLALVLFGFVQATQPPMGLDASTLEHIRICGPIVAIWIIVFSLPLFIFVPDTTHSSVGIGSALLRGLGQIYETASNIRRYGEIGKFLIARMMYMDGLNTLFVFGGPFAVAAFGMSISEVALFGILLNITGGIGALVFGWLDDKFGAKPTILFSIVGVLAFGVPILLIESKLWLFVFGGFIGLYFGPIQSASRSFMTRMAPPEREVQMFGLFAFSGKATAFLGPFIVALVVGVTGSVRWGMAAILPFIIAGGLLLLLVRTGRAAQSGVLSR
jgi:UMF1 family MFS transporter